MGLTVSTYLQKNNNMVKMFSSCLAAAAVEASHEMYGKVHYVMSCGWDPCPPCSMSLITVLPCKSGSHQANGLSSRHNVEEAGLSGQHSWVMICRSFCDEQILLVLSHRPDRTVFA